MAEKRTADADSRLPRANSARAGCPGAALDSLAGPAIMTAEAVMAAIQAATEPPPAPGRNHQHDGPTSMQPRTSAQNATFDGSQGSDSRGGSQ